MTCITSKDFFATWKHAIESDFQHNGTKATYFPGHPKQWGMEDTHIKLPERPSADWTSSLPSMAVSEDGNVLVAGSDQDLLVYSLPSAALIHKIHHTGPIGSLHFQPGSNSRLAISCSAPVAKPRRLPPSFVGMLDIKHAQGDIASTPDPLDMAATRGTEAITQVLAGVGGWSTEDTHSLFIWEKILNILSGAQQLRDVTAGKAFEGHFPGYGAKPFSNNGSYMLYLPDRKIVAVLDITPDKLKERFRLIGHTDAVMWAESNPDDTLIGTSSWDGTVRIWDASIGAEMRTITVGQHQLWAGAWSSDGKFIAIGSGDKHVRLYATDSGDLLHTFSGFEGWIRTLAFSPGDRKLACGAGSGTLRVFDVQSGDCMQHFQVADGRSFIELGGARYTKRGLLVFKSPDGRIYTYDELSNQKGMYEHGPLVKVFILTTV
ncbi:WD40 repeat-like protein [Marasmius fiardii PR-910]|nr:WD40 repeat-like protein [Marasmius fiardii PR-910]